MGSLGLSVTADMAPLFEGVLNGQISQYSLENVKQKFQLLLFYPGDWSAESELLLSSFSAEEEDEEDKEEVGKVVELPPCKCVVITDNQSVMLELVNTSLALEELVTYTQERLNMLLQKRRLAVDRARNRDRIDEADQIRIQRKLGDMSSLSASLVRQSRDRSDSRGRSMGRSLSRSGRDRVRLPQQTKDPLFEHQLKRTVDRLVKGFF